MGGGVTFLLWLAGISHFWLLPYSWFYTVQCTANVLLHLELRIWFSSTFAGLCHHRESCSNFGHRQQNRQHGPSRHSPAVFPFCVFTLSVLSEWVHDKVMNDVSVNLVTLANGVTADRLTRHELLVYRPLIIRLIVFLHHAAPLVDILSALLAARAFAVALGAASRRPPLVNLRATRRRSRCRLCSLLMISPHRSSHHSLFLISH